MSSPSSFKATPPLRNRPMVPTTDSSTTIRNSPTITNPPQPLVDSPSSITRPLSTGNLPLGGRVDLAQSAHDHAGSRSVPRATPVNVNPGHASSLSLPESGSSFRSRSRSPLGQIDDTLRHWNEDQIRHSSSKSPSSWWTKFDHKKRNIELQEPVEGWQHIRSRVIKAASSVLGPTADITREAVGAGVDLLELAPIPGLAQAARTLLVIWEALAAVDMNRTACFRLTERCAEILLSVREDIHEAGDVVGGDLKTPIDKLVESFTLVYSLLQNMNRRPFIKRYLKRDEIVRQIAECDKALTDALGMFNISIQLRILRQVQASELQRQAETRLILEKIMHSSPQSNALQLTGVETDSPISPISPVEISGLPQPTLALNDVPRDASGLIPALRQFHIRQNTLDAQKDLTDLRHLMNAAIQTSSDAQMLEVFQIGRDEMPEAIKTLQRALERIIERDSPVAVATIEPSAPKMESGQESMASNDRSTSATRRLTRRSLKGGRPVSLRRSKTDSSVDSKAMSNASVGTGRARDTLDREFIESGLDALRRMSQGVETLPSWTITRYEVDREEKIGVGFFSDVYKGKWRGRTVAIKVLAETTPRDLFIKEAEIWKSLRHPHVLELYGASSATSDPPWFFVSPYEKNGSLPAYLRQRTKGYNAWTPIPSQSGSLGYPSGSTMSIRRASPARDSLLRSSLLGSGSGRGDRPTGVADVPRELDLYRFMHEIAKGMDYLHNVQATREVTGILHGDLKAANVLIDDRFRCVISDFGQSEMKSEAYRISGQPLPHGTLRWQAPELMGGSYALTTAMDVYAFAICCIEILLLGRIPWSSNDDSDVRHFVLVENHRPDIPDVPPFNSSALHDLIQACWDRDPSNRPTFTKIVQEIRFIRRSAGQSTDDIRTPHQSEILDEAQVSRSSPDMRPTPLPPVHSNSSEEPAITSPRILYPVSEASIGSSSLYTQTTSSQESLAPRHGYESPIPRDDQAIERKHEMRYRMLLIHDFHPSLTLPLWEPALVKLGSVGYLSRPSGGFITLFDSFSPEQSLEKEARRIPSLHGYGKVNSGTQRQDRRNMARRGLDMISGLLTFRNSNVSRRYSLPLHSGHKAAYLFTETTIYRYMENLDAPKRWFSDNVDRILKIYSSDHPITREDLFLVVGTLDSPDHALFVSHKHPDSQVHFDIYAVPKNGQPWGAFAIDTQVSPKLGGPDYHESPNVAPSSASRVSNAGDGSKTLLLARLRFKPDNPDPTSL